MDLFDRFFQERTCLKGVSQRHSAATDGWGGHSSLFYQTQRNGDAAKPHSKAPGRWSVADFGSTHLRRFKAYVRWLQDEGHLKDGLRVQFLKTESKVLATFTPERVRSIIAFKPKGINQTRTHTAALLILDGEYRIGEVLGLPSSIAIWTASE